MRIGFDAKRAFCNTTGLGNYSRGVIKNMCTYHPEHTYFLYTPPPQTNLCTKTITKKCVRVRKPKKGLSQKVTPLWRSFGLGNDLAQDRIDIYHGLSNELPFRNKKNGLKTVVTIHDLIFMRYPHYYNYLDRQVYKAKCKYACQHADKVIAVSQQTKEDIVTYFNVPSDKVEVVYQSCGEVFYNQFERPKRQKILQELALPDDFMLFVGSITERKNLMRIAEALAILREREKHFPPLVVVGKGKEYKEKVLSFLKEHKLGEKVIWRTNLHMRDLACLFQQAKLFLYPSQFEGFGIPIIEALFSKTPVITSNGSCFPEAGGPDSWYVDPDSPDELATAMQTILSDKELQKRMAERGFDYVQRFHKQQVTEDLMQLYLSLR
ncbi:glycosyltransferase family 4 protein [Desulfohalobium retbaense]|uniref:Glycosyl transferase group 1 n=1 Tax=Desulfohalobium retbaense (strain ATCC 49708 / DSM 5692 / JCM 16813 / HR100) TaxID=485915 RepID=C8X1G9_DESRD|nr:glycosyltransferase family 1 protein [Desulfohalobium retbaense]ACV68266.1 glycosyl transferase group 1 [Desulfohalobium retbaense DSM 5692]